jgi:hypothetical protein
MSRDGDRLERAQPGGRGLPSDGDWLRTVGASRLRAQPEQLLRPGRRRASREAELLGRAVGPRSGVRYDLGAGRPPPHRSRRRLALRVLLPRRRRARLGGRLALGPRTAVGRRAALHPRSPLSACSRALPRAALRAAVGPARGPACRRGPGWARRDRGRGGHGDRGGGRQSRRATAQARPRDDQEREGHQRGEPGHVVPADPAPHAVGAHRAC